MVEAGEFMGNQLQYKRCPNVEAMEFEKEWLIMHADQYTVTRINEAGGVCWSLLQQTRSVHDLADELLTRYDIGREDAESDVESFLRHMQSLGLVAYAE